MSAKSVYQGKDLVFTMAFNLLKKKSPEDIFWEWFAQRAEHYYNSATNGDELFAALYQQLGKIDEHLIFEFGPINELEEREMVISANGVKEIFPKVTALIEKAPDLAKWKFIAFRQRLPELEQVMYNDIHIYYDDVYFRFAKDFGKIGLEVHMRGYDSNNPDHDTLTYILLDQVLGEYDTEMKLSRVEVTALDPEDIDSLFPLKELPIIVDNYIKEFHN